MDRRLKIAFIVQRYGVEVNGGAELHCRQLAERMIKYHDVDVLTTCAVDYMSWKNEYEQGAENINGVNVVRFKVDRERNIGEFNKISERAFSEKHSLYDEIEWMWKQGPVCEGLMHYIKDNKSKYDVLIFITYLYFTTYAGIQLAPEKSILIPTAHDEPPIYLDIFNPVFNLPRGIFYNTIEERNFVNRRFNNDYIPSDIGGVGIEVPNEDELPDFRDKFNIRNRYVVYVGRIDESKGCKELFEYFIRYKEENPSEIKLILLGKPVMEIPKHKDIISLGFVTDEEKFAGIKEAEFLIIPSKYESLSIVVLEAFKLGKPVLANGYCDVLRGHCLRSNAGLYYNNYYEFSEGTNMLMSDALLNESMGANGRVYVEDNYDWEIIKRNLCLLINKLL